MKRLLENQLFFRKCRSSKHCRHVIKNATPEQVRSVCECAKNVYVGNIPLSRPVIEKLRPFKKELYKLSLKTVPIYKKKLILQKGGAFFLPILASIASALIGKLIKNHVR